MGAREIMIAVGGACDEHDRVLLVKHRPGRRGYGQVDLPVAHIDYLAERSGGDLRPDSDIGEARWIPQSNVPEIWDDLHEDTQTLFRIAEIV